MTFKDAVLKSNWTGKTHRGRYYRFIKGEWLIGDKRDTEGMFELDELEDEEFEEERCIVDYNV